MSVVDAEVWSVSSSSSTTVESRAGGKHRSVGEEGDDEVLLDALVLGAEVLTAWRPLFVVTRPAHLAEAC